MGLGLLLLAAFIFAPPIYQFIYFSKYYTISKLKAFFWGFGYWTIIVCLFGFPILFVYESGTVAMVIAGIIGLALTVGAFYFILKKRAKTLATIYPDDKFIVLKETVACIGMVFGSILLLYAVMFSIFLPFLRKRD